jgi:DNA repair protein RadC
MRCDDGRCRTGDRLTRGTERCLEQLWTFDTQTLSDAELIAVLLRGWPEFSALEMARELIGADMSQEGLTALAGLTHPNERLAQRPWFADAWIKVRAAVELGRRLAWAKLANGELLVGSELAADYLIRRYGGSDQEIMGALFLNVHNRLIALEEIFRGTLSYLSAAPPPILKAALRHRAAALILFHNHPSGDPTPSIEDLCFTRQMAKAGEVMGVRLVDHLIVAIGRWVSLRRDGPLEWS